MEDWPYVVAGDADEYEDLGLSLCEGGLARECASTFLPPGA